MFIKQYLPLRWHNNVLWKHKLLCDFSSIICLLTVDKKKCFIQRHCHVRQSARLTSELFAEKYNFRWNRLISKHFCSVQYGCIFLSAAVWGKTLTPWGGFVRDMDCLSNTVQRRQWSLCKCLFSGDNYSSGDLPIDCLLCRM